MRGPNPAQDIDYDENFKFYMTTKMSNPHYLPDVCIKALIPARAHTHRSRARAHTHTHPPMAMRPSRPHLP